MPISLLQTLRDTPLAFVDVETTGASADFGHRVIEIGVCRHEGGRCVAEYEQLLDPERKISPGVTAITGITQAMVAGQPKFTEQLPRLLPLLQGAIVLGHNVRFDLGFLRREFRRAGQELTAALGEGVQVMDTVRIARRRFGRGGNALQSLAPRLGYQPDVAHRALADARSTAFVFEKLMEPVGGWDLCLCDAIKEQGGPMGLMPVSPRESLLPLELEEALEQRCAVMMEYLDARQKRTQRLIEPLTVRRSGGELLMVAFCHMRQERRTFKLDRIVQLSRPPAPDSPAAPVPPVAPVSAAFPVAPAGLPVAPGPEPAAAPEIVVLLASDTPGQGDSPLLPIGGGANAAQTNDAAGSLSELALPEPVVAALHEPPAGAAAAAECQPPPSPGGLPESRHAD